MSIRNANINLTMATAIFSIYYTFSIFTLSNHEKNVFSNAVYLKMNLQFCFKGL